ncbi:MAG: alpha/beta fold hydrolase [Anaerolineae bacterium]
MNKLLLPMMLMFIGTMPLMLVSAQEEGTVMRVDFDSTTLNRVYQYNVYLPAGYENSDVSYPVIYLLHGRGDTMDAWLNVRDVLDEMITNGTIPPLIAIMPDMPSSERASYYVDSLYTGTLYRAEAVETAFINDLIPQVDASYRTLAQRESRLIGGYSMGGYGALRYVMAHPELFSGALVLSPAVYVPLPPSDSSTREFGAFGAGDSLFDDAVYQSLNYPALVEPLTASGQGITMFIAVGDDEWKNPSPQDYLHDLDMEAHMVYNTITRIPNVLSEFRVYDGGHDWQVWRRGFIEGMPYLMRYTATS